MCLILTSIASVGDKLRTNAVQSGEPLNCCFFLCNNLPFLCIFIREGGKERHSPSQVVSLTFFCSHCDPIWPNSVIVLHSAVVDLLGSVPLMQQLPATFFLKIVDVGQFMHFGNSSPFFGDTESSAIEAVLTVPSYAYHQKSMSNLKPDRL